MSNQAWGSGLTQYFYSITPEVILESVEQTGLRTTGRTLQLNSYENRVYEVEIDDGSFVIIKFYRPGRWSKDQIQDEHDFLLELVEQEIEVIPPMTFSGRSLFEKDGIYFCLYKKTGGRTPYDLTKDDLLMLGRTIGRIHLVGKTKEAKHRLTLIPEVYGRSNLKATLSSGKVLKKFKSSYEDQVNRFLDLIDPLFENKKIQRIHGDCHIGNILWQEQAGPMFLDFDDFLNGPSVQDIWLLAPGLDEAARLKQDLLIQGYEEFLEFDYSELSLIEPLRGLRYIHFTTWISKRWDDPIFQMTFPHFGSEQYWSEQIFDINEQIDRITRAQNGNFL